MVRASQREHINTLLKETITLLCKNGLTFHSEFSIEALIGITLDKHDVFLVNINEKIVTDAERSSVKHGDGQKRKECTDQSEDGSESSDSNWSTGDSPRKKRRRSGRRRKRIKKKNDQDDNIVRNQGVEPRKDKLDYKEAVVDVASTESPSTRPNQASNNVKPDLDLLLNLESAPTTTSRPSHTVTRDREPVDSPDECTEPLDWTVDDIPGPSTVTTSRLQSTAGLLGDKVDDWLGASSGQDGEGGHSVDNAPRGHSMNEVPIPVHIKLERVDLEGDMLNDNWNHKLNDTQQQQNLEPQASSRLKIEPLQELDIHVSSASEIPDATVQGQETTTFSCLSCTFTTNYIYSLRRHEMGHTNGGFVCDFAECTKSYQRKEDLTVHVQSVHNKEAGTCQHCGKQFSSRRGLQEHEARHTEQPRSAKYQCHSCDAAFHRKISFEGHINAKHRHEKPFRCTTATCNRAFAHKSSLVKHMEQCERSEGTTQPIRCEVCSVVLATKAGLNDHMKAKHSDTRFACSCGKTYGWRTSLYNHQNKYGHKN